MIRVWYSKLRMQYKKIDAIDYFEESLRKMDQKIMELRKKEYEPVPLAFVTMNSVASCVSDEVESCRVEFWLTSSSKWLPKPS